MKFTSSEIAALCRSTQPILEQALPDASGVTVMARSYPSSGRGNFSLKIQGREVMTAFYDEGRYRVSHLLGRTETPDRVARLRSIACKLIEKVIELEASIDPLDKNALKAAEHLDRMVLTQIDMPKTAPTVTLSEQALKPTMSLDTRPGDKVIFTGRGGYESERERAHETLTAGGEYIVKNLSIEDFSSRVFLEGHATGFNTVMFDNAPEAENAMSPGM